MQEIPYPQGISDFYEMGFPFAVLRLEFSISFPLFFSQVLHPDALFVVFWEVRE